MFKRVLSIERIQRCALSIIFLLAAGVSYSASKDVPAASSAAYFNDRVLPILTRCVQCHDGAAPLAGLKLTSRDAALKGGVSGPALIPGDATKSLLYKMVASSKMPPGKPLTVEQIDTIRVWIDSGALWPYGVNLKRSAEGNKQPATRAGEDWWSLQPVTRPRLPTVKSATWPQNPIDQFVLATLESNGLKPSPSADRITLIRRAKFDLLGIPPTPVEVDAFVRDRSPEAYKKLIDRLLASPRYGERWARHWLDVARFAESQGFERDKVRDFAWRYRDYVIRCFNEDRPYMQFVREQIAGDVLEPITHDGIIATGFLVSGPWDEVGNQQQSQLMKSRVREEEVEDMISAVGQTFLGMTVNCARCHDHKFDPIPQRDYYRLKCVFEGVYHGDRSILTPEETRIREIQITTLTADIRRLENEIDAIDVDARSRVLRQRPQPNEVAPAPIARWTFESGAADSIHHLDGTLEGGARVSGGRLRLNGAGQYLRTAPIPWNLREKTLQAWVLLPNLEQRGAGVMSVESLDKRRFDGIVFGEREPKKWIAGSNSFVRTRDLTGPAETSRPDELIHLAIVYRNDKTITVYRNGIIYGDTYQPSGANAELQMFVENESCVLFGLRHTGAANGFLTGEIEEARLYDRALTPEEIASSYRAGVPTVTQEELLGAMSDDQRQARMKLSGTLNEKQLALKAIPPAPLSYAANPRQPEGTFVLVRGDVENRAEQVSAGGLSAVKTPTSDFGLRTDAPEGERRVKLAEWIANPQHPLTARVMVNRIWHYHFGRGVVASPNDFGFNGERPSHPELLDWLAAEFVAQGWSIKKLHKLIMMSNTYMQSTITNPRALAVDSDNRLLWRFPPQRLEAEEVRDAMLCASGQMNQEMGGPSFRPFTVYVNNSHFYTLTDPISPEYNRRTIYRINVNSAKDPLLETLDCPDPSVKAPRRSITTTPLQALAMMNNSFVMRQAKCFAERVVREGGARGGLDLAFRLALGRPPTAAERAQASTLIQDQGMDSLCWVLLNAAEFVYIR